MQRYVMLVIYTIVLQFNGCFCSGFLSSNSNLHISFLCLLVSQSLYPHHLDARPFSRLSLPPLYRSVKALAVQRKKAPSHWLTKRDTQRLSGLAQHLLQGRRRGMVFWLTSLFTFLRQIFSGLLTLALVVEEEEGGKEWSVVLAGFSFGGGSYKRRG